MMLFNIGKKLYKILCKINDNKLLIKIITHKIIFVLICFMPILTINFSTI